MSAQCDPHDKPSTKNTKQGQNERTINQLARSSVALARCVIFRRGLLAVQLRTRWDRMNTPKIFLYTPKPQLFFFLEHQHVVLARAPLEFLGNDIMSHFGSKLCMATLHDSAWVNLRRIPTPETRVGVAIANPSALEIGAWNPQGWLV